MKSMMHFLKYCVNITLICLNKKGFIMKKCKCGSLWSVGKFISTVGNVSAETIKKYIAEQKGK